MFKNILKLFFLTILLFCNPCVAEKISKPEKSFAHRKEVKQFIQEMHQKHGMNKKTLTAHFNTFGTNQKVLALMNKQYEALPWYQYRDKIVTEKRVKEGALFWKQHEALLKKTEQKFGVPAEIIVAILGVETSYGKITGNFPVLQTLATLAFDYPRRAPFFRKELEDFLLLTEEGALHPTKTLGSYAGAMGMPQFMPSSYKRYAVDFSQRGQRDLIHNTADVIGSVANYLKTHGWRHHEAIAKKMQGTQNSHAKNSKSEKNLHIVLKGPNQTEEQWLGFKNFQVIKRYNNSNHYSMAVYQLSTRIRDEHKG